MIVITKERDLESIVDENIKLKISDLLQYFLKEYSAFCAGGSIEPLGAIIFIQTSDDFNELSKFGVTVPLTTKMFEWLQPFSHNFLLGCLVLDNDRAINIIFNKSFISTIEVD